jgi:tRNA A-37 threonylcarbamoyl transferase component Bud32
MTDLAILDDLPDDYVVERGTAGVLALHREVADAFRAVGFGPDTDGPIAETDLAGRKRMHELKLDAERFVVRRFTHGGLLRWLTGSRFRDPERPFREILLAQTLVRASLPTPQVVAARARRRLAGGWSLEVVTRRIEGSLDLGHALARMGEAGFSPRLRGRILAAAGALVRGMHRAGFLHADLTANNLLLSRDSLSGAQPRLWILDLDRSQVRARLEPADERRNLGRLLRHVTKLRAEGAIQLHRTDVVRFLRGYEPDAASWKDVWRPVQREYARTQGLHAPGWALERRLSRRVGGRAS